MLLATHRLGLSHEAPLGIVFFLPNMTWIQPPGYVHQMINTTWAPNALQASVNATQSVSASAQLSADKARLVVRLTNSASAILSVTLDFATATRTLALKTANATVLWADSPLDANPPATPTAISPIKSQVRTACLSPEQG